MKKYNYILIAALGLAVSFTVPAAANNITDVYKPDWEILARGGSDHHMEMEREHHRSGTESEMEHREREMEHHRSGTESEYEHREHEMEHHRSGTESDMEHREREMEHHGSGHR